jgi:hypothetical protein
MSDGCRGTARPAVDRAAGDGRRINGRVHYRPYQRHAITVLVGEQVTLSLVNGSGAQTKDGQ